MSIANQFGLAPLTPRGHPAVTTRDQAVVTRDPVAVGPSVTRDVTLADVVAALEKRVALLEAKLAISATENKRAAYMREYRKRQKAGAS